MATDIPVLECPIDVMYAIHHALRAEAARVETLVARLEEGDSLQPFRQAFYRWTTALAYHADTEDAYMTALDAPFMGGVPPWHLILVTSPAVHARITAAVGEGPGRDASPRPGGRGQARSSARTRARLAEAPLHLAVTYDRGGPEGLERALDPSMDAFRACGALQNLWLGACDDGLGVE